MCEDLSGTLNEKYIFDSESDNMYHLSCLFYYHNMTSTAVKSD